MMPPEDIEPRELWMELSTMPRAHRVVPFPRKRADGTPVGHVAIWVLSQGEHIAAQLAAEKLVRSELAEDSNGSLGYEAAFSNATTAEILYRACRNATDLTKPAFPNAKDLRAITTVDEMAVLFNSYMSVQTEVGPIVSALTKGELDAWLDRLVDGGSALDPFVSSCSPEMLRALLRISVARLGLSPTDSASAGSPPESTPPDTQAI